MTEALIKSLLDFSNDMEPFLTHNHMYTAVLSDGCATVVLPMCVDCLNRWGGAHGGILFSLCDVAMGMAIMTRACGPPERRTPPPPITVLTPGGKAAAASARQAPRSSSKTSSKARNSPS